MSAVNECEPNPCNGHICQNELSGYKCICSDGYTGHHCDVPPNFCEGNDCENGATCTNGVTNYTYVLQGSKEHFVKRHQVKQIIISLIINILNLSFNRTAGIFVHY